MWVTKQQARIWKISILKLQTFAEMYKVAAISIVVNFLVFKFWFYVRFYTSTLSLIEETDISVFFLPIFSGWKVFSFIPVLFLYLPTYFPVTWSSILREPRWRLIENFQYFIKGIEMDILEGTKSTWTATDRRFVRKNCEEY